MSSKFIVMILASVSWEPVMSIVHFTCITLSPCNNSRDEEADYQRLSNLPKQAANLWWIRDLNSALTLKCKKACDFYTMPCKFWCDCDIIKWENIHCLSTLQDWSSYFTNLD